MEKTLSEGIWEIHSNLTSLAIYLSTAVNNAAGNETTLTCEQATLSINALNKWVDACRKGMKEHGWKFAATRGVNESFKLKHKEYTSAHEAVYFLAILFLERLWFEIDKKSYEAIHHSVSPDTSDEDWAKIHGGTGLSVEAIQADWERSKYVIEQLLPLEFPADHSVIVNALNWERAALKAKQPESSHIKRSVDNETEIPPEYRDGGKPNGEPLTVAYVSKDETYKLKGPYLAKQRLSTMKHGRALVYRFADIARLSAAKNRAENEGH
jgi:hypothetical protein